MARRRADFLGVRAALSGGLLPGLVGTMSFLAALALGGALACAHLAASWRGDAASALTIQVPQPDQPDAGHNTTRLAAVQALLQADNSLSELHVMGTAEVNHLMSPWLGGDVASLGLTMPAIITAQENQEGAAVSELVARLQQVSPGTFVKTGALWAKHVTALTTSLQACALAILVIVASVAIAVVAVVTRAGIAQLRENIDIVYSLGAQDADIAARFAGRATWLAFIGALCGTVLALPVLAWLAWLAAPFTNPLQPVSQGWFSLSPVLLGLSPLLPGGAALIGWVTAQTTVRGWLRRLP